MSADDLQAGSEVEGKTYPDAGALTDRLITQRIKKVAQKEGLPL